MNESFQTLLQWLMPPYREKCLVLMSSLLLNLMCIVFVFLDGICSDILTRLQKEDVVLAEVPTVRQKTVFFFAVVFIIFFVVIVFY